MIKLNAPAANGSMSVTIYIVGYMSADTVTNVSLILGLVKEIIVEIAIIVILVTIVAHIVIGLRGLKESTDRFRGFIRIPIPQVSANQRACSGSFQCIAFQRTDAKALRTRIVFAWVFRVGPCIENSTNS